MAEFLRRHVANEEALIRENARLGCEEKAWSLEMMFACLGPPVVPFYRFFFGGGCPYYRKKERKRTLILTSLLEELVVVLLCEGFGFVLFGFGICTFVFLQTKSTFGMFGGLSFVPTEGKLSETKRRLSWELKVSK